MFKKKDKDIRLNIKPLEVFIRASIGFSLPVLIIWFRSLPLIILICAVSTYMLVTAMLFYCPLKYFLQHTLTGRKRPTDEEKSMPLKEL